MSQNASFLTDYLFPGLLCGFGLLGLSVVNALAGQPRAQKRPTASPGRANAAQPNPRPRPRRGSPRRASSPQVVPVTKGQSAPRIQLRYVKGRQRLSAAERDRFRVFVTSAKPARGVRISVIGYGDGQKQLRLARKRTERVAALLRSLVQVPTTPVERQLAPPNANAVAQSVTVVIGR